MDARVVVVIEPDSLLAHRAEDCFLVVADLAFGLGVRHTWSIVSRQKAALGHLCWTEGRGHQPTADRVSRCRHPLRIA